MYRPKGNKKRHLNGNSFNKDDAEQPNTKYLQILDKYMSL